MKFLIFNFFYTILTYIKIFIIFIARKCQCTTFLIYHIIRQFEFLYPPKILGKWGNFYRCLFLAKLNFFLMKFFLYWFIYLCKFSVSIFIFKFFITIMYPFLAFFANKKCWLLLIYPANIATIIIFLIIVIWKIYKIFTICLNNFCKWLCISTKRKNGFSCFHCIF